MKKYFIIFIVLSYQISLFATCELPKKSILKIACSINCGMLNSLALKRAASRLNYNIELFNLSEDKISIKQLDGLIIPGGEDLDPKNYSKYLTKDFLPDLMSKKHLAKTSTSGELRDQLELPLIERIIRTEELTHFPLLGICRGMQAITVVNGIPLYLDIETELDIPNRIYTLDKIQTENTKSQISQMLNHSFYGVELHHQGLRLDYFLHNKERWPNLSVTATSNNKLIAEVIEYKSRPILGVQFHPEYTFGTVQRKIYDWILIKSCQYKNSKDAI